MRAADPAAAVVSNLRQDLSARRCLFVAAVAFVLSLEVLFQPDLLTFWTPFDVALAWLDELLELLLGALAFMVALSVARSARRPYVAQAIAIVLASFAIAAALAWRDTEHALWVADVPGEALRWGLLAALFAAIDEWHRRTQRARDAARTIALEQQQQAAEQAATQLQLLEAQIEPHFLFNTLANVRRIGRSAPADSAAMVDRLVRYLQAALPQLQRGTGTLGEELELTRDYLQLMQMRMGERLRFDIDAGPALLTLPFPQTTVLTLVENAIKHGLDPQERGGHVMIRARDNGARVLIDVIDDGVGPGASASSGSGVGLLNTQRRLRAHFGRSAALELLPGAARGAVARIDVPAVTALDAATRPRVP